MSVTTPKTGLQLHAAGEVASHNDFLAITPEGDPLMIPTPLEPRYTAASVTQDGLQGAALCCACMHCCSVYEMCKDATWGALCKSVSMHLVAHTVPWIAKYCMVIWVLFSC